MHTNTAAAGKETVAPDQVAATPRQDTASGHDTARLDPDTASLDPDRCWEALLRRDPSYDGRLFVGVLTTGIYCRLTCPARRPLRKNVRFLQRPPQPRRRACVPVCGVGRSRRPAPTPTPNAFTPSAASSTLATVSPWPWPTSRDARV
jgi:hypothetical protein